METQNFTRLDQPRNWIVEEKALYVIKDGNKTFVWHYKIYRQKMLSTSLYRVTDICSILFEFNKYSVPDFTNFCSFFFEYHPAQYLRIPIKFQESPLHHVEENHHCLNSGWRSFPSRNVHVLKKIDDARAHCDCLQI